MQIIFFIFDRVQVHVGITTKECFLEAEDVKVGIVLALTYRKLWVPPAPYKPGMMVHICSYSTWEMEAGGYEVQGYP